IFVGTVSCVYETAVRGSRGGDKRKGGDRGRGGYGKKLGVDKNKGSYGEKGAKAGYGTKSGKDGNQNKSGYEGKGGYTTKGEKSRDKSRYANGKPKDVRRDGSAARGRESDYEPRYGGLRIKTKWD
ncbi:MAG: hypothetical protein K2K90_02195, partial [Lachnospiraceae bacterium]|nr:hypothetical protein [Lachnospiraceae bacterium]